MMLPTGTPGKAAWLPVVTCTASIAAL